MKNLLHSLILLALYCAIALVACGTRKVATEITENKATQDVNIKEQVNEQSGATTKATDTQTDQTEKVEEKQEYRITELFNENGSLRSRIKELLNSKSTDNSSSTRNRTFDETRYRLVNMERMIDTKRTVTSYEKKKTTSSERYGFSVIGLVLGIAFGIWGWPAVKRLVSVYGTK